MSKIFLVIPAADFPCLIRLLEHYVRSQLVSLLDPPVRHRAVPFGQGGIGVSRPDGLGEVDPRAHLPPGVDAQGEPGHGGAKDGIGLV